MIIGLAGRARSGKDTTAQFICDAVQAQQISFAQPLRDGLKAMFNLRDEHFSEALKERPLPHVGGKSPRTLMQTLGTEWGREMISRGLWTELAMHRAKSLLVDPSQVNAVVISDVRFDEEAAAILESGGVVIEVVRPGAPKVAKHSSEMGVNEVYIDHTLVNDGTLSDLQRKVEELCLRLFR